MKNFRASSGRYQMTFFFQRENIPYIIVISDFSISFRISSWFFNIASNHYSYNGQSETHVLIGQGKFVITVCSRLNAGGVYLKLGLTDPAFIQTRRSFGARRLFIKCICQPSSFYHQYWRFIELRTKFQQKR